MDCNVNPIANNDVKSKRSADKEKCRNGASLDTEDSIELSPSAFPDGSPKPNTVQFSDKTEHGRLGRTVRCVSNGETENEADVSSLSSQEEMEIRQLTIPVENSTTPRGGYTRLQSLSSMGGGDTSGGEEVEQLHHPPSSLPKQLSDIPQEGIVMDKSCPVVTSNDSQHSAKITREESSATDASSPAGAILDLNGTILKSPDCENGYLAGVEMHEFRSSDSPAFACELRIDMVGGRERGRSVAEVKEIAYARLQEELRKAQEELKLKDEEVDKLSRVRDQVGAELEELTASLFQAAHDMVREANIKKATAEKALKEATMKLVEETAEKTKIDVLQAEVQALKALVLTSTPSMPNRHLHPHLDHKSDSSENGGMKFLRGHRRSPSHNNLKYGRESTPPGSPEKEPPPIPFCPENYEIDPIYHKEFVSWRENPEINKDHEFLTRIYMEDIFPCLNFTNKDLASEVQQAVENNSIIIESVSGKSTFPKRCALSEAPRLCKYRMKLGDNEEWFFISQLCRNRIAAVCDFLSYLRYIEKGLVKGGVHDVYWEIIRLRKQMALARLGIS